MPSDISIMNIPKRAEDALEFLRIVQDISLARDFQGVTGVIKRAGRELTQADGITIVLRDNEQCYYVDEDAISPLWKGKRFPLKTCISGWAMLHRDTAIIEDIYQDARIPHNAYRPTFVKSLVMTPVRAADPIAAIGAYWADHHRATQREIELLQSLADITATALENIQLVEALKTRAEENAEQQQQIKHEIHKRKEVEEQFRQAQKMEAIGRLAGGIAHDFNNLLMVISGYSEMALRQNVDNPTLQEQLEQIHQAGKRATALTRQLLSFSRKQVLKPVPLDLNQVVTRLEKMLQHLIGADIELISRLHPDIDMVCFDPSQIEQIIMNLALNARDAMPEGGKLIFETNNVHLDEIYAQVHVDAQVGPHVMLAVSDNGSGMDEATREKIFEPFFTTKAHDKGTGLGLATVYGIVKQSGGNIWVYSEPGHGTTFKIYIPRATSSSCTPEARQATQRSRASGGETILLTEDNQSVRDLVRTILESDGFHVLAADNSEDALTICKQQQHIDLLLTDIIMPGISGPQLARHIVELRPAIKVAYMSGYTDNATLHHGLIGQDAVFIEKPIAPVDLLNKIKAFLAAPASE